ncbi:hypothetical protein ACFQ64_26280 [Streptomyces sp. NPDC056460]|uniref:hypothetical protein n=1 Tax=Streptomyces sp. NPDC056460 TaxID=3345825 RepID=UPI0036AC8928
MIEAYECRALLRGEDPQHAAPWTDVQGVAEVLTGAGLTAAPWTDVQGVAEVLTGAGLTVGEDFQLVTVGRFPLVGTGFYETTMLGAFSQRLVDEVEALDIRVRVSVVVGESHERTLDALRGARSIAYQRPAP